MTDQLRKTVMNGLEEFSGARLTGILGRLDVPVSSWYRRPPETAAKKPRGPAPCPLPDGVELLVLLMARAFPKWGYKKVAVACRRFNSAVTTRHACRVMKEHGLLRRKAPCVAEAYQAGKLYELLPSGPDGLWQMDVTYVHIPGHGWWYVITVIDYYSRYLLASHFTDSYSAAEAEAALASARAEAERIRGPLEQVPFLVTDNGSSFIAKRFVKYVSGDYSHVRIRYRTPTQLGLLERFHRSFKEEEVYFRVYESPSDARESISLYRGRYNMLRPHWALVPEAGVDALTPYDVYACGAPIRLPKWQSWARKAKEKLDRLLGKEVA